MGAETCRKLGSELYGYSGQSIPGRGRGVVVGDSQCKGPEVCLQNSKEAGVAKRRDQGGEWKKVKQEP